MHELRAFSTNVQSACLIFVHLCSLHTIGGLGRGRIEVDEGEDVSLGIVHGARVKDNQRNKVCIKSPWTVV